MTTKEGGGNEEWEEKPVKLWTGAVLSAAQLVSVLVA